MLPTGKKYAQAEAIPRPRHALENSSSAEAMRLLKNKIWNSCSKISCLNPRAQKQLNSRAPPENSAPNTAFQYADARSIAQLTDTFGSPRRHHPGLPNRLHRHIVKLITAGIEKAARNSCQRITALRLRARNNEDPGPIREPFSTWRILRRRISSR
jgi:hypothetical protein